MQMSEEMALRLHRMMWSDMQRDLGNMPNGEERIEYKERWIKKHFPDAKVQANCFLCEFTHTPHSGALQCTDCPIKWPYSSCTTEAMHYQSAPISKILALPARNGYLARLDDAKVVVDSCSYYKYREELISNASGLPADAAIKDHVTKIQEKAVQQSNLSKKYGDTKMELAKASGYPAADGTIVHISAIRKKASEEGFETAKEYLAECSGLNQDEVIFDHIRAIKEKAVEEYFANTPGAKLVSMDVDDAFKQYAKEQTEPIFKLLSEASGLAENNHAVMDHICLIKNKARQEGRDEKKGQLKDLLAKESNLDRNRPVDDHIREIVKNSMEAGATEERDRIQEKIYEVLLS